MQISVFELRRPLLNFRSTLRTVLFICWRKICSYLSFCSLKQFFIGSEIYSPLHALYGTTQHLEQYVHKYIFRETGRQTDEWFMNIRRFVLNIITLKALKHCIKFLKIYIALLKANLDSNRKKINKDFEFLNNKLFIILSWKDFKIGRSTCLV